MKIEKISPEEYVVLVTGDRNWTNLEYVANEMETLPLNSVIVHGYAKGLDTVAHVVACELGLRVIPCPAHWRHDEPKCVEVWGKCSTLCNQKVGKAAGVIRNRWMYNIYHPRVVLGFHENIHESRGTKDMLKYAMKHDTPTFLHDGTNPVVYNPKL